MWQYITLMKRIYLIDCPGVVPPNANDSEEDILLRGVVRVENVENPHAYIPAVLKKTKPQHIERTYDIRGFSNATQFLELLARKGGRLLKGGEADVDGVAKMVLNDFLRGKIPWFTPPPLLDGQEEKGKGVDGRKGALGEMGKKRKAEDSVAVDEVIAEVASKRIKTGTDSVPEDLIDPVIAESTAAEIIPEILSDEDKQEEDDFEDFDEDGDEEEDSEAGSEEISSESVEDEDEDEDDERDVEEGGATLLQGSDLLGDEEEVEEHGDQELAKEPRVEQPAVASLKSKRKI